MDFHYSVTRENFEGIYNLIYSDTESLAQGSVACRAGLGALAWSRALPPRGGQHPIQHGVSILWHGLPRGFRPSCRGAWQAPQNSQGEEITGPIGGRPQVFVGLRIPLLGPRAPRS